ncbi:hypothetical protein [Flagellimonas sp.]|uniref:hypothetical protein n=1 Tax=Flagellimonas sp. TaxID=2058762 RepID=UPI003BAFB1E3
MDSGTGQTWINYQTIPKQDLQEYGLPKKVEKLVSLLCDAVAKSSDSFDKHLFFLFNIIWEGKGNWESFLPYYKPYYLEHKNCIRLAKTHAIINEILRIKREKIYPIKTIYHSYMKMPHVFYKAGSLQYFYKKIRAFEKGSIHEVLMHKFKYKGREPYKITSAIEAIIKRYYISKKRYSISMIHNLTNLELVGAGKTTISRSAVSKVCNTPEFRNKADFIRYGSKYAEEKLLPYLKRKKLERRGILYQIDGKDLRLKCLWNGEVKNLILTAIVDVYSGKIVGHHLDITENAFTVFSALKMAFEKNKVIPEFIFYDKNVLTRTEEYRQLKKRLLDYGCRLKECRANNPKAKGNLEKLFSTFSSNYMVFLKGFLGSGITAKSPGARANKDLERVYLSDSELKTFETAKSEVNQKIAKYNSDYKKTMGTSPELQFKHGIDPEKPVFGKHDIAYLFGKLKEVTVRNGMILITENGEEYSYRIEDRSLVNRLNRTKVRVSFYPHYPYQIYVFDTKNNHVTNLKLDSKISPVPSTDEDIEAYQYFYLKNIKDVTDNVVELLEEIEQGEGQFRLETPIDILENPVYSELEDLKMEDFNLMMKEFANSKPFGKSIRRALANNSEEYQDYKVKKDREYKSIN